MERCYNVTVSGKVQDVGFRYIIEDIARLLDIKGFAFNDIDGSLKMVCSGDNGIITKFFNEIRTRGVQKGIVIDDIQKEEIPFKIFLPDKFSRLYTDEIADLGRKLDIGIGELKGINTKLSLSDGRLMSIDTGITDLNSIMASFRPDQKAHNQNLERILEKMTEKMN